MANVLYPTTSLTQVANLALALIGHSRIQNIDTPHQNWEFLVRDVIFDVIKEEQSDFYWPELKTEVTLTQSSSTSLDGSSTLYNIPADAIQLIRLTDNTPWIRVGDFIRIDIADDLASDHILEYIRYSEDPSEWSPVLRECIYTNLARYIAMPITQQVAIAQNAQLRYEKAQGRRDRAFKSGTSPIRRRRGTSWNMSRLSSRYASDRYSYDRDMRL